MTESRFDDDAQMSLETAIAENPEEVARLMRRLGLVNEFLDAGAVAANAMDDEMVTSLVGTATVFGEAADAMATPGTVRVANVLGQHGDALADAIESVVALQESGTLDDLLGLAELVALGADAMDDEMVITLVSTMSSLAELAHTAEQVNLVENADLALRALDETDPDRPVERVGLVGLMRAMRDPAVQTELGDLLQIARSLGRVREATARND